MSTTRQERDLRRDDVLTAIQSLMLVVVVATFIVTFIVQPFRIPSESMEPTLHVGDFLLMNKEAFSPQGLLDRALPPATVKRSDVAVFHHPVDPGLYLVKRIVALPGDRLRLRKGHVFVNDRAVDEPYAFYAPTIPDSFRDEFPAPHSMDANVDPAWWSAMRSNVRDGELYVPADRYFVLGDNRNDSEDSRYWGFVPRSALVGRPLLVYFSLGKEGESATVADRLKRVFSSARWVR